MQAGDRVRYRDDPRCTGTIERVKRSCIRVTRDRPVDYGTFISTWVESGASLWEPLPPAEPEP